MAEEDRATLTKDALLDGNDVHDEIELRLRHKPVIGIQRPAYRQPDFDHVYKYERPPSKTFKDRLKRVCSKCDCSTRCAKKVICQIFPFLTILRGYSLRADFLNDLISGLTVGVMHIPQGMAYGMLTNLPPVYGLYTSFFPVIVYFFFGTSKHISIGTFAVVSLMIGSAVDKAMCSNNTVATTSTPPIHLSMATTVPVGVTNVYVNSTDLNNDASDKESSTISHQELMCTLGVATATTFMAGCYQLLLGVLRMGFVTEFLAEPLTRGFTTGAAMHVLTSQIKHVFGINTARYSGAFKIIYTFIDFFRKITTVNWAALLMALICMVIIYIVKEFVNPRVKKKIKMPLPIELIMVVLGTMASYFGKFSSPEMFEMKVVGEVPRGIPAPALPPASRFGAAAVEAFGIAIVAIATNVSMSKLFAKKNSYELDSNQELVAYGVTNIAGSMLNSFMSTASLSRSLVQEGVGGKTQVAGLVSCSLLLVVLLALGPLFEQLPNCVLAAIIIVNLKGMFLQLRDLGRLWMIAKYDFWIWLVVFLAIVVLDVDLGLLVGVLFSLLTVVVRTQRPYTCILGRVDNTEIYKDVTRYKASDEIPGVKIFRFDSAVCYINAEYLMTRIYHETGVNPRKIRSARKKAEKRMKKEIKESSKKDSKTNESLTADGERAELGETQLNPVIPGEDIKTVIIDCTSMSYIDATGIAIMEQIVMDYEDIGVQVALAGCKGAVRDQLQLAGCCEKCTMYKQYPCTQDAVAAVLENQSDVDSVVGNSTDHLRSEDDS